MLWVRLDFIVSDSKVAIGFEIPEAEGERRAEVISEAEGERRAEVAATEKQAREKAAKDRLRSELLQNGTTSAVLDKSAHMFHAGSTHRTTVRALK